MTVNSLVMTSGQVARAAHVAPRTVAKWYDSGALKGYRLPGSMDRRFKRADVREFFLRNGIPLDYLSAEFPHRVLLVGLPGAFAGALAALLSAADGYEVAAEPNGFAAGARCVTFVPTAAVVDASLGLAQAGELARVLRAGERTKGAHLVLTVYEDADPEVQRAALGFDAAFSHPLNPAAVADHLRALARTGADI